MTDRQARSEEPPVSLPPSSADDLLGSVVVGWKTVLGPSGRVRSQTQLWGTVVRANQDGIVLEDPLSGSQEAAPFDREALSAAEPGDYRLRENETALSDPDWVAFWVLRRSRAAGRPPITTLRVVR